MFNILVIVLNSFRIFLWKLLKYGLLEKSSKSNRKISKNIKRDSIKTKYKIFSWCGSLDFSFCVSCKIIIDLLLKLWTCTIKFNYNKKILNELVHKKGLKFNHHTDN